MPTYKLSANAKYLVINYEGLENIMTTLFQSYANHVICIT